MRYRLRTLLIASTIAPPVLAIAYWVGCWMWAHALLVLGISFVLAYLSLWIIGPLVLLNGIVDTICGPSPAKPSQQKPRRTIRVRIGRYAGEST